jgi:metal-sulfur cluster biosynthetic enzyme
MIENRKENIGVIEKKTGDILANIDEVKDVVIKHLIVKLPSVYSVHFNQTLLF